MLTLHGIGREYSKQRVKALTDVNLTIQRGDFIHVEGPSGSGKTTLLMILGGMLRPTAGRAEFMRDNWSELSESQRIDRRRRHIGFVFQMFHLIPYLSLEENVRLGMNPRLPQDSSVHPVDAWIAALGLEQRRQHSPHQLSSGEQQRAALCRALVKNPDLLLADEPTGNLDPDNARSVLQGVLEYHRQGGTVVWVSHQPFQGPAGMRHVELRQGQLTERVT